MKIKLQILYSHTEYDSYAPIDINYIQLEHLDKEDETPSYGYDSDDRGYIFITHKIIDFEEFPNEIICFISNQRSDDDRKVINRIVNIYSLETGLRHLFNCHAYEVKSYKLNRDNLRYYVADTYSIEEKELYTQDIKHKFRFLKKNGDFIKHPDESQEVFNQKLKKYHQVLELQKIYYEETKKFLRTQIEIKKTEEFNKMIKARYGSRGQEIIQLLSQYCPEEEIPEPTVQEIKWEIYCRTIDETDHTSLLISQFTH
jgi:hypothetical protein